MDKRQREDVLLSATNDFTFYSKFKDRNHIGISWLKSMLTHYIKSNRKVNSWTFTLHARELEELTLDVVEYYLEEFGDRIDKGEFKVRCNNFVKKEKARKSTITGREATMVIFDDPVNNPCADIVLGEPTNSQFNTEVQQFVSQADLSALEERVMASLLKINEQINNPKQEEKMTKAKLFETVYIVNGNNTDNMSDDELLNTIADFESKIKNLRKIEAGSKTKDAKIREYSDAITSIVELLDSRGEK